MRTLAIVTITSPLASLLFSILLLNQNALYVIGGKYVLEEGETLEGDLNLLFARAVLEEGACVSGHVYALSSDMDVRGIIEKNTLAVESRLGTAYTAQLLGEQRETHLFDFVVLIPELRRLQIFR